MKIWKILLWLKFQDNPGPWMNDDDGVRDILLFIHLRCSSNGRRGGEF